MLSRRHTIAHLHFRRTVYKAGGNKAAGRLDYMSGKQVVTHDKAGEQIAYISNGREDLVAEGTRNLPTWAPTAHDFFAAAEQYERQSPNDYKRRGIAFEEWKITLPHELSREQNQELIDDLLDTIAGDRLPCTYAFHEPQTLSGSKAQPHIHLLISGRITDDYERTPDQHFKRWNSRDPGRGGAQKDAQLNHQGAVYAHRLMISDVINVHLETYGHAARVHPATLESRGIDRKPEPKLAPSESQKYREQGKVSDSLKEVLAIRQARAEQGPGEQNQAWQYWQERKAVLGLTREMPREEQVAQIVARRQGTAAPTPQRSQPRQPVTERSAAELDTRWSRPLLGNKRSRIYHLPTHKNYGDVRPENQVTFRTEREAIAAGYRVARNEVGVGADTPMSSRVRPTREQTRAAIPRPRHHSAMHRRGQAIDQQMQALLARMNALEAGDGGGRGVRVRLHDEDEERAQRREHGMSW